ncbi:TetR/AcrR family transcriptional regulator [Saccharopolyspora sp. K220]|nr:TetR/AcrR family transcriptional regulator [Saccharopolyspora soli]
MRGIAAEVGVTPTALLRHFETKEELLAAVLQWWATETMAITRDGQGGIAAFERLRELMRYHTEHRGLLELFTRFTGEASHPAHPARPFITRRYETVVHNLTERLLTAAEVGEVPPLTQAQSETEIRLLCSVMDGLEIQWLLDPGVDLVGLFDKYLTRTLERWKNGSYDG